MDIRLPSGHIIKIDNEDYDRVQQYKWYMANGYVRSPTAGALHTLLTGYPRVRHIDGDQLNCRRSNLTNASLKDLRETRAQGGKVYEGKPCMKCGSTERLVSTGRCRACNKGWVKKSIETRQERDIRRGDDCGICQRPMEQPCHDHRGGVTRGWICHGCNLMIGHARDSAEILARGAAWVRRSGDQAPQ